MSCTAITFPNQYCHPKYKMLKGQGWVGLYVFSFALSRQITFLLSDSSDGGSSGGVGVPVAMAGGKLTLKVTIKQTEGVPGPKLEVDGFLGSLHVLLSPQQLGLLLQMARDVAGRGMYVACTVYATVNKNWGLSIYFVLDAYVKEGRKILFSCKQYNPARYS